MTKPKYKTIIGNVAFANSKYEVIRVAVWDRFGEPYLVFKLKSLVFGGFSWLEVSIYESDPNWQVLKDEDASTR